MCGIFGIYSDSVVTSREIQEGLKKLQYRGYDSWGYYMNGKTPKRFLGKIFEIEDDQEEANLGIGHTRWATHGEPSEKNTHPVSFVDKSELLDNPIGLDSWLVVHNGIITNHEELVNNYKLKKTTDTDTEVIVLLADYFFATEQKSFKRVVEKIVSVIEGTYAFILVSPTHFPNEMIATCKGSPLIVCETEKELVLTSDQSTLPQKSKYAYAKHGDIIHIRNKKDYEFSKPKETFETVFLNDSCQKQYQHHMIKEIIEQPEALRNMFKGRIRPDSNEIKLGGDFEFLRRRAKYWTLIGCGSSYNACIAARPFLEKNRIVNVELASDFVTRKPFLDVENTAYVIVSQSGETRDCIEACEYISGEWSGMCYGINNRPGCLLDSKTIAGIHMNIGTERSVPATKSFTATIIALMMLDETKKKLIENVPDKLEQHIQRTIHENEEDFETDFIIGDSWGLGLAREFSLKLQEVAYQKAMWFPGHEMKHGPLALVDDSTKVIYYGLAGSQIPKILESRGAKVIHSSEHFSFFKMICDIASMQIMVYKSALKRGLPIDTPRNLAKSVTV